MKAFPIEHHSVSAAPKGWERIEAISRARPKGVNSCLQRYDGTDCCQWYKNVSPAIWVPVGPVFLVLMEDQ